MSTSNKKYDFNDKVALVTGSSSGIGKAIAIAIAEYGAKLTITGRDTNALNKVSEEIENKTGHKPLQIIGDLVDHKFPEKLLNETINKYKRLDFLINNAGAGTKHQSYDDEKFMESFDNIFTLNVRSVVQLTILSIPYLIESKGNILNISSVASMIPYSLIYCSSKAALDMVTKTFAKDLGPKGVRVNSINPGPVETNIGRYTSLVDEEERKKIWERMKNATSLKFLAQPIEIANLASFLLSDDAKNITGSIIVSDTGFSVAPKFEINNKN